MPSKNKGILMEGKQLLPEEMPIKMSMWKGEVISNMVTDVIWSDGVKSTILLSSIPILDECNQIIGAIATSKDFTIYRQLEQDLFFQKECLEKK